MSDGTFAAGGHAITLQILISEIIARHSDANGILASAADILERSRKHHLATSDSQEMRATLDAADEALAVIRETVVNLKRQNV